MNFDFADQCTRILLVIGMLAVVIICLQALAWWRRWEP